MTSHLLSLLTLLYNSQKSNAEPLAWCNTGTPAGQKQFYIYATIMRKDTLSHQYHSSLEARGYFSDKGVGSAELFSSFHLNDKLWLEKS